MVKAREPEMGVGTSEDFRKIKLMYKMIGSVEKIKDPKAKAVTAKRLQKRIAANLEKYFPIGGSTVSTGEAPTATAAPGGAPRAGTPPEEERPRRTFKATDLTPQEQTQYRKDFKTAYDKLRQRGKNHQWATTQARVAVNQKWAK